jgi:RimJ/RimL family protein N-acetyltransferase
VTTRVLRPATADDVDLLYSWRNDSDARENSFSREVIDRTGHGRWLDAKLAASQETRIWILVESDVPVGQIRYDRSTASIANISLSIDSRFRGRGLGTEILRLSAPRACQELGVHEVHGVVKAANTASIVAFERAGFRRGADSVVNGEPAVVFLWDCGAGRV